MRNFGSGISDAESGTGNDSLQPIQIRHLKDEAYHRLKEAIVSLQLPPGEFLVEARLAQQLGVSKTPVRHALIRLEKEHFVHTVPFKGTYVHGVTEDDMRELFELRLALEQAGVQFAVARAELSDLQEVRRVLDQTREVIQGNDPDAAAPYIQRFHVLLMQAARSGRLMGTFSDIDSQMQRMRILAGHIPGRLETSLREHEHILNAVEERDDVAAVAATRDHLNSLLADYLNAVAAQTAGQAANPGTTPARI